MWLETGYHAGRAPGEIHGPFTADVGCFILELSFPNIQAEQMVPLGSFTLARSNSFS
jgi:hypothetical protein